MAIQTLDLIVIALYGCVMLAIGAYYAMRTETVDDYLLGGRRMNPIMVGLSLFATMTSTLTYLAVPGEMVKFGPMMMAQLAALPIAFIVAGWWLIPAIMRQNNVTSGYELLERRLGVSGRLMAAGMFILLRTFWMGSILYATSSKVIVPLLNLEDFWTPYLSIGLGVLTLAYTSLGGLRAVVLTDALQSMVMLFGAIATISIVSWQLGGVEAWWPKTWAPHWQEPVFWFSTSDRATFMGAVLNMFVWYTCNAGSDQMALQRYFATRNISTARRSFATQITTDVCMTSLLALSGLAVLGYFTAHPEKLGAEIGALSAVDDGDKLFPRFVLVVMPAGLTGLVIAAILSAAMSSLSSGMNSASAVLVSDFMGRLRVTSPSQQQQIFTAKWVSILVGCVAILLSTVVGGLAANLLELCIKVVNLLTAPIFVLFFLALFVPWSTPFGGLAATVASVGTAVAIAFFKAFGLEILWSAPISLVVGIVVGMAASRISGEPRDDAG